MSDNNTFKISHLDGLRIFALAMVILRHSFAPFMGGTWGLDEYYESNYFAQLLGKYVSTISMPLYVFISGILFSYLRNTLHKYSSIKILLNKKNKRLVRPYIIFAPIYIIIFLDPVTIIDFFLIFFTGAGHLWFLLMIFTVFMLFYPFENYFKKNILSGFIIILICYCLHPVLHYFLPTAVLLALKYMPFFYFGYMYFYKSRQILFFLSDKIFLLVLLHAASFFVTYLIMPEYIGGTRLYVLLSTLLFLPMGILSISFLFMIFSKFHYKAPKKINKLIKNINTNSYYIYILHQPFLMLFFKINFLREWHATIVIVVSFCFCCFVSIILSDIIMKFRLGKKIIGAA